MRKKNRNILIGVGIFLVILILLMVMNYPRTQTFYVTDPNLGIIKYQLTEVNWVEKILSIFGGAKQATFASSTAFVGDTVSLYDTIPADKYIIRKVNFGLYDQTTGQRLGYYPTNFIDNNAQVKVTVSYSANRVGKILAPTEMYTCDNAFDKVCDTLIAQSKITDNVLTITEKIVTPTCDKKDYWTEWTSYAQIEGGEQFKRSFKTVTSTCTYSTQKSEYKTTCNSDFVIANTQSSEGTGKLSCVSTTVTPENPVIPENPIITPTNPEVPIEQTPSNPDPVINPTPENTVDESFMQKYEQQLIYVGAGIILLLILLIFWNIFRKR